MFWLLRRINKVLETRNMDKSWFWLLTLPSLSSNIAESSENGIGLVGATCMFL